MKPSTIQQAYLLGLVVALLLAASTAFAVLMTVDLDRRVSFDLTDHDGRRVSHRDLSGKYALVYFGFTHCPKICPTQMTKISSIVDTLGGRLAGVPVVPVFLSVDPERDTVRRVREYVSRFHPAFVGLTGHRVEIARAASSFRSVLPPPNDGSADYEVAHQSVIYLVGPDGRVVAHIPYAAGMADSLARIKEVVT